MEPNSNTYQRCLEECSRCAEACDYCAIECLREERGAEMGACVRLDIDCAETCRLCVALMSRRSDFSILACILCARICLTCEAECDRHDEQYCRHCAQLCRTCAAACREVAQV